LKEFKRSTQQFQERLPYSREALDVLNYANIVAQGCNHDYKDSYHLLGAILATTPVGERITGLKVELYDVYKAIKAFQPPLDYDSYLGPHNVSVDCDFVLHKAESWAVENGLSQVTSDILCLSLLTAGWNEEHQLLQSFGVSMKEAVEKCTLGIRNIPET
jgi:ATP-dependent Clp protease ATP-binding subunit ClpA